MELNFWRRIPHLGGNFKGLFPSTTPFGREKTL
jgi:hypothetical protein